MYVEDRRNDDESASLVTHIACALYSGVWGDPMHAIDLLALTWLRGLCVTAALKGSLVVAASSRTVAVIAAGELTAWATALLGLMRGAR